MILVRNKLLLHTYKKNSLLHTYKKDCRCQIANSLAEMDTEGDLPLVSTQTHAWQTSMLTAAAQDLFWNKKLQNLNIVIQYKE
jgi:hypothetical protein